MAKKISEIMLKALRAIHDQGDYAIAEGGGSWLGLDGRLLSYPSDTVQTTVGTNTIYALEDRGLLSVDNDGGRPYHHQTRRITAAGLSTLGNQD